MVDQTVKNIFKRHLTQVAEDIYGDSDSTDSNTLSGYTTSYDNLGSGSACSVNSSCVSGCCQGNLCTAWSYTWCGDGDGS